MKKLITAIVIGITLVSCNEKKEVKLSSTIKLYTDFQYEGVKPSVVKEHATQQEFNTLGTPTKSITIYIQDEGQDVVVSEWTRNGQHLVSDGDQVVRIND